MFCQEFRGCRVRLAVGRRRRRPDLKPAVDDLADGVVFRAWLHANIDDPIDAAGTAAVGKFGFQNGSALNPETMIVAASRMMIANTGEISSPPSGGMIRRNGRSNGSVSV